MSWINFFFFVICLNAVTGTVAYFFCRLLTQFAENIGAIRIVYPMYRLVEYFYIVPVGWFCNRFRYFSRVHTDTIGDFFLGNRFIRIVVLLFSIVWIIGAVVRTVKYIRKYADFLRIKWKNIPFFNDGYMDLMKRCYPRTNWKHVTLCTNFLLKSPCVMGTFRYDLVFPEINYTKKDMTIILMHEATHIARHDNFWKKIALCIIIVNWFNPLLKKYITELDEWSDTACDITVCKRFLGSNPNMYFEVLMRTRTKSRSLIPPFVSQMSSSESLKRRMERMIKWKLNGRKALASVLLTAVLVAGSSVTALAAGAGAISTQQAWYEATRNVESTTGDSEELKVYEIPAEEVDEEKWANAVVYGEEEIEPLTVQKYFNWNIPGNIFARSTAFIKRAGTTIIVSCYVYSSSYHRVGIRRPDGSQLYVLGKGQVTKTFNCEKYGTYYVYVENLGSTDLYAAGYYIR